MTIDPRKSFQESTYAKVLHEAVASSWFQEAAKTALVAMQFNLPTPGDMGSAANNALRLAGAQQFLATLMSLTEKELPRTRPVTNLNHKI